MTQGIYLDYAATTPVDPEVLQAILPYFTEYYQNPSALYSQKIKYDLAGARKQVAMAIGAMSSEIVFTSGGTEANNLAILGTTRLHHQAHFITSQIEHDSVLQSFKQAEKEGHRVTYLPVDSHGLIDLDQLQQAIRPETRLISIMTANNEIGTIQDIKAISEIARGKGVLFHTDGVQAIGQTDLSADYADFITLSGHKIYGPKGVGALYVKKGIRLQPLIFGGHQESGRRGGTENVVNILAFGKAMEKYMQTAGERRLHLQALGDQLKAGLAQIDGLRLNGHPSQKVAGIYHVSIGGLSTEVLLTWLDMKGIRISAGSACQAGTYQVSHVLKAIGDGGDRAHIRISLGQDTNFKEIAIFIETLGDLVNKLRNNQDRSIFTS